MNKSKAVFFLTMPGIGSWNGKWTGSGNLYAHSITRVRYRKNLFPGLEEKSYDYDFGDGWYASIRVEFMTPSDARKVMKRSKGFCGYTWMIDSICKNGKIVITSNP